VNLSIGNLDGRRTGSQRQNVAIVDACHGSSQPVVHFAAGINASRR
jgi:hypothetical protein